MKTKPDLIFPLVIGGVYYRRDGELAIVREGTCSVSDGTPIVKIRERESDPGSTSIILNSATGKMHLFEGGGKFGYHCPNQVSQYDIVSGPIVPDFLLSVQNKENTLNTPKDPIVEESSPCPHYELMKLYAEDARWCKTPWFLWEVRGPSIPSWTPLEAHPTWNSRFDFRRRTDDIQINGNAVPRPIYQTPENRQILYCPNLCGSGLWYKTVWEGLPHQMRNLRNGLYHYTSENAEKHTKALLSLTQL